MIGHDYHDGERRIEAREATREAGGWSLHDGAVPAPAELQELLADS